AALGGNALVRHVADGVGGAHRRAGLVGARGEVGVRTHVELVAGGVRDRGPLEEEVVAHGGELGERVQQRRTLGPTTVEHRGAGGPGGRRAGGVVSADLPVVGVVVV